MPLLAHYDRNTGREQTLDAHCKAVGHLCSRFCGRVGLKNTGLLTGLLHDPGKASTVFQQYLQSGDPSLRGTINHSTCGARILAEQFGFPATAKGLACTMAAAAICGHHSGLPDCLSPNGADTLHTRLYPNKDIYYDEAAAAFGSECLSSEELRALVEQADIELQALLKNILSFCATLPKTCQMRQLHFGLGLFERYLFSALIDGDRYDAYLFEHDLKEPPEPSLPLLWERLRNRLEDFLSDLKQHPRKGGMEINQVRGAISDACRDFAGCGPGIYQLRVPTGGGKTYASFRFALHAAAMGKLRHIFYIAPYKTILEQNAREIRGVLKEDDMILEHHSDVVFAQNEGEELARYTLLTQRWEDSPIILTTMVQFLQTLFSGKNACARRFHALAGSVILLDEIQAIPIKFVSMLNCALNFLAYCCGCTIVLCTATQPQLDNVPIPIKLSPSPEMVPEKLSADKVFCRANLVDMTTLPPFSTESLAILAAEKQEVSGSLLVVLNTKSAARQLYKILKEGAGKLPVYYLSTALCPAHRLAILDEIRARLDAGKPLIAVSTQLIEAGVDISFGCVIRSLAGLDSIAQAAGRCNRHGGVGRHDVLIVRCADESLSHLPDIREAQKATNSTLEAFRRNPDALGNDLLSPQAIQYYYDRYYREHTLELDYWVSKETHPELCSDVTLLDLLSANTAGLKTSSQTQPKRMLNQAFGTAGSLVKVIEQSGIDCIVPYGEGRQIISDLLSNHTPAGKIPLLLRQAQRFSLHLFEHEARALEPALFRAENCGALILSDGYYDSSLGLCAEGVELEFLAT